MKLRFEPTLTIGNIFMMISFLIPAGVYGFSVLTRVDRLEQTVSRLERTQSKIADSQHTLAINQERLTTLLSSHMDKSYYK